MIRNFTLLVVALFFLMVFLIIQDQRSIPTRNLLIFYTSNLHAQLNPFSSDTMEGQTSKVGGIAFIRAFIDDFVRRFRMNQCLPILLDTGDSLFGSPEASLTMGEAPFDLMEKSDYDAMAIGNMEFEFGMDVLRKFALSNRIPLLACNYRDLKAPLGNTFLPSKLIEREGFKIGVVGLGHADLARNTRLENVVQIEITDMKTSVQKAAVDLRTRGAEVVVLLSHHPGFSDSRKDLAELFPEVDVIIGDLISQPTSSILGRPVVCQTPRARGAELGIVRIPYIGGEWSFKKAFRSVVTVDAGSIHPNPDLLSEIQKVESRVDNLLEEVIAFSQGDFKRSFNSESTMGNLITDTMRKVTGSQIAFQNSGSIKSTFLEGPISLRDLYEVLPFENNIVSMNLFGWQIENMVEDGLSARGSFLQSSGIQCTYCSLNPPGFRVIQIGVNDEPLEAENSYRVAVTDFMLQNSFSWPELAQGRDIAIHGMLRESLKQHFTDLGTISPFLSQTGSQTNSFEQRFIDIQSEDETLRKQALLIELASISENVLHSPGIESGYGKLIAEILRADTDSDFSLVPHNFLSPGTEPLKVVSPMRILSDMKEYVPVQIVEIPGVTFKKVLEYSLVASEGGVLCFAGLSIELKDGKLNQIFPWEGDFDPTRTYKVAIPGNFPVSGAGTHKWYDISNFKRKTVSSDLRRLFINGIRRRQGKVEIRRAIY
ncbi:5'-nucleotidase C-terminal domain-containing protein [bacterium]|nr:5'-nucleotidase C-terminal domain-containing protein [bacterium]